MGIAQAQVARAAAALDGFIRRADGSCIRRRELIALELGAGARPAAVPVPDRTAQRRAAALVASMNRGDGPPLGNPCHPDTIRYREAQRTAAGPENTIQYRMVKPDGSWRVLTKAEFDHACR